jgi:hypothetical protein
LPRSVFAVRDSKPNNDAPRSKQLEAIFVGKSSADGRPVLYVCQNFACQAPSAGLAAIKSQVEQVK